MAPDSGDRLMRMDIIRRRDSIRISRRRRLLTYVVGAGLWATGALWLLFHFFLQRQTDFGPTPHPLEYWWRSTHGFFGFASLWTFGLLWGAHVADAWKSGRHRVSGSALFAVLCWLIVSGYLLYYLGNDRLISVVSMLHWSVGLLLPVPFIIHRLSRPTSARHPRVRDP